MGKFLRFIKAVCIALVLAAVLALVVALITWTKGLFLILAGVSGLVYTIYKHLEWRERSMRKGDRK